MYIYVILPTAIQYQEEQNHCPSQPHWESAIMPHGSEQASNKLAAIVDPGFKMNTVLNGESIRIQCNRMPFPNFPWNFSLTRWDSTLTRKFHSQTPHGI